MNRRLFGALGPIVGIAVGCGLSTLETSEVELHAAGTDGSGQLIINPSPIIITGFLGSASVAPYSISFNTGSGSGSGSQFLMSMNLGATAGFTSTDPACTSGGAICNFGINSQPIPTTMAALHCTPGASPVMSTMTVTSQGGLMATAPIQCGTGSGAGGGFSVQSGVGRFFTPVGTPVASTLVVTSTDLINPQTITVTPGGTFSSDWSFGPCPNSCLLPPAGQLSIPFSFTPPVHGDRDAFAIVSSSAVGVAPQNVDLLGTGQGAKLRIDQPQPMLQHDFGTIAKGQTVPFSIAMTNLGNVEGDVNLQAALAAPFSTTSTLPVAIGGGNGMGTIDVACSSLTSMPQQMAMVTLVPSANTYSTVPAQPLTIQFRCTIADTTLQVTPTPLDFGELRVGDPQGSIPITITNPPTPAGSIMITRIALVNAPGSVQLSAPPPQALADNASINATLTLATGVEVTAAELMTAALEIDVAEGASTETLVLPITGKVGKPAAVVIPSNLDLGTACIDRQVSGEVRMTNVGTSTLKVQPPTMADTTLVPLFTNPSEYPPGGASLLAGDHAIVTVRPETNTTPGRISSTLTWSVDVPTDFAVPVSVELLDQGTAASPARLVYGSVSIIDPPLNEQTITLENCGPDTAFVQYDRVIATAGSANAWRVDPEKQARELFPEETMRVRVSFRPTEPGRHEATLSIDIGNGMKRTIALEGDATGVLTDKTSFYACDCSGSSGPGRWTSLLIPLATLFVLRRRRRR